MGAVRKEDEQLIMHTPVLLQETIDALSVTEGGRYIDGTFGEGGHSEAIVRLGGLVLGIDRDSAQIENYQRKGKQEGIVLVQGNFSQMGELARQNGFYPADGIILDLGLSMEQLRTGSKGLSYRAENEELDMRLDLEGETAADILITRSENELYEIFARYGEEIYAREIAVSVKRKAVRTVKELLNAIDRALLTKQITSQQVREKSYARIFQALRIVVNSEVESLKKGLKAAVSCIKPEGRICVITFHSLEDRMVKQFVRENSLTWVVEKKRGVQSFERSATLRVFTL